MMFCVLILSCLDIPGYTGSIYFDQSCWIVTSFLSFDTTTSIYDDFKIGQIKIVVVRAEEKFKKVFCLENID